ncbi:MAG: PEP-CTERM sorting domain-containing protein [Planctomycetota bacterium]|jgi:hypothetical protein
MKKVLAVMVLLIVCVGWIYQANASVLGDAVIPMWRDEFGDPLDAYVEAAPGDTVRVYHEVNYNPYWQGLDQIRAELWWDTAVIANYGSGDGTVFPTQFYDNGAGWISDVANPPGGNYNAAPDWSTPQYNHYLKLDFFAQYMWTYEGMRVVGYDIPIRPDAPMGTTTVGMNYLGVLWGGVYMSGSRDDPDPYALHINVVPEPATLSLFALGGLAAVRRIRRRK